MSTSNRKCHSAFDYGYLEISVYEIEYPWLEVRCQMPGEMKYLFIVSCNDDDATKSTMLWAILCFGATLYCK